jgi:hypothetical protein
MKLTDKQKEILSIYKKLLKDNKRHPSRAELIGEGISRDKIKFHFGNGQKLKAIAESEIKDIKKLLEKKPHIHSDFTKDALGNIIKENDYQEGTFFVTAVSPVSYLDWSDDDKKRAKNGEDILAENLFKPGFDAVQNFLKKAKAELVLLPMPAHVKALEKQPLYYDPKLKKYKKCFATEFTFNPHLKAVEAHLNPQQINPLTGLRRLKVHRYTNEYEAGVEIKRFKTSIIVAHSKQMMEVIPTGNESHPRLIHSTGTISAPSYLRNRIGMIANEDHKLGGLIIEIRGDVFWMRQVQFDVKNGSFVDLGKRYHADGRVTEERAEAFKMGDIHPGHHDQKALNAIYNLWEIIKPKRIFFEDFFDGSSISHHLVNKRLSRAKLPLQFSDLPTEIKEARKCLEEVWDKAPKDAAIYATASNHPEHVMKYLDEGRYINDKAENYNIAHRMVVMSLDGKNPLKEYLDPNDKMIWTDENEDIHIEGVQMNVHGHLGLGGSRGSKIGHELAHDHVMVAHSHTPSIYHNCFTVGHTTHERHGYNNGPSTWILCSGAVYKGGQKQLYMIIKGNAFRPKNKTKKST